MFALRITAAVGRLAFGRAPMPCLAASSIAAVSRSFRSRSPSFGEETLSKEDAYENPQSDGTNGWFLALGQWATVEAQLTRGPYLQNGTATSIIVRWRTAQPRTSECLCQPRPHELANMDKLCCGESPGRPDAEIELTGLTPSKKYYYFMGAQSVGPFGPAVMLIITSRPRPVGTSAPTRVSGHGRLWYRVRDRRQTR